jgi:hypothetical protein
LPSKWTDEWGLVTPRSRRRSERSRRGAGPPRHLAHERRPEARGRGRRVYCCKAAGPRVGASPAAESGVQARPAGHSRSGSSPSDPAIRLQAVTTG